MAFHLIGWQSRASGKAQILVMGCLERRHFLSLNYFIVDSSSFDIAAAFEPIVETEPAE